MGEQCWNSARLSSERGRMLAWAPSASESTGPMGIRQPEEDTVLTVAAALISSTAKRKWGSSVRNTVVIVGRASNFRKTYCRFRDPTHELRSQSLGIYSVLLLARVDKRE